jgi:hypothetical protein
MLEAFASDKRSATSGVTRLALLNLFGDHKRIPTRTFEIRCGLDIVDKILFPAIEFKWPRESIG